MPRRRGTSTSRFGSAGRESHDASFFYASRMYQEGHQEEADIPYLENPVPEAALDRVLVA